MSTLTVNYDHQKLLERVNEGDWLPFCDLKIMEFYYSDVHNPPGFYVKIGTRSARLVRPLNVINPDNSAQSVQDAEVIRPSPGNHCYDAEAIVVVSSMNGREP